MCLIDHDDNVVAGVQFATYFTKFEYSGYKYLTHVSTEERNQFFLCRRTLKIGDVRSIECCCNLRLKVDAVINDNYCRVLELRIHAELLSSKYH